MKKRKKPKLVLINIKVTEEARLTLVKLAKRYAHGNLSAWLRMAGSQYIPRIRKIEDFY